MIKSIILTISSFYLFIGIGYSQTYCLRGKIIDDFQQPIQNVGCILQSVTDTLSVKNTFSDENGSFGFVELKDGAYILFLTHMSYEYQEILIDINGEDIILEQPYSLQPKDNIINEITIAAKRPLIKQVDNKLVYDASMLRESKVVSNAFDILRHLPNLIGGGDNLQLAGASEFAILIDGKPSTLTKEQIIKTLKSMPASRVSNIEVMYSTPPQYNIRGAAINIVLENELESQMNHPLQGEIATEYIQGHHPGYNFRTNLLYNKPSFKIDLTIEGKSQKEWNRNRIDAIHQIQDDLFNISLDDKKVYNLSSLDLRLSVIRILKNKSSLSLTYTGSLAKRTGNPTANAIFYKNEELDNTINSRVDKEIKMDMHNVRLDYTSSKHFTFGADYTIYQDPTKEIYRDFDHGFNNMLSEFKTTSKQQINKILLYADHSLNLGHNTSLNYGIKFNYSKNHNNYDYFNIISDISPDSISRIKQQEYNYSAYVSFSKRFNDKFSIQASFSGGMYKGTINTENQKQTLWDNFEPLVNANISYNPSSNHMLQFSFSSNIQYPPYWALSNNGFRLNAYSILQGNPSLKFSRKYNTQLVYIINRKYTILGFNSYIPNYFTQIPYQSSTELQNIFQMVNLDYQKTYGIVGIVPFELGKFLDSKVTVNFFRQIDKSNNFNNLVFKNSNNSLSLQIDNTFNILSNPNIKGELLAHYFSGAIQGIYHIRHFSNVTAGLKWQSKNKHIEIGAQIQDIFRTTNMTLKTNFENQNLKMRDYANTPFFRLTFIYRFSNYSKKEKYEIDKSRFDK